MILKFIRDSSSTNAQIIHHIQISTRYHSSNANLQPSSARQNWHKPQISEKTAELLSQSASSINHQQLKTALLKIASHSKNHKKTKK
jgi:hypothetical protein